MAGKAASGHQRAGRDRRESAAGRLRFSSDTEPGIRRLRRGRTFIYLTAQGRRVRAVRELARIRALAVPPAYRDVWVCRDPRGHLQATGRDARGRKQYRYHPHWRVLRDANKFDRMLQFGRSLPRIRRCVARDLRRPGLPRERVLATLVRLLEHTLVRVGNEEYVRANGSYGLTTLRNRHVRVRGQRVVFEFRGKRGVRHRVSVDDPSIARIVQRCAEIPGQELFQWLDAAGERHRVDSGAVNDYLRGASGGIFTAKDFRTWFASLEALQWLRRRPAADTARGMKREVTAAIAAVAGRLGNTPAVCRRAYVHPQVLDAFKEGRLARLNGCAGATALRRVLRQGAARLH
ncbi:MAG TPA: DNA topoisomerase IB [Candidatus Dormibacteraeota bacterium]|nr:DNA topoisomerase IB [Candidatus Dormibacteraeota bacterium]